jgi:hypothetical protein
MDTIIISQLLLIVAILTTGVVYGTDVFHAIVVKKASALSKSSSIADFVGHTHLVADKRMPLIGVTSILCTLLFTVINYKDMRLVYLSGAALVMLFIHLTLYLTIAKPINIKMSQAATENLVPEDIHTLQQRWDSIINYRAVFLMLAMIALSLALMYIR